MKKQKLSIRFMIYIQVLVEKYDRYVQGLLNLSIELAEKSTLAFEVNLSRSDQGQLITL